MLLSGLANLLNRGLPRSPRARELCAELTGRTVAIEVRGIAHFTLLSNGSTLELRAGAPAGPAAQVSAGLSGWLTLLRAQPVAPHPGQFEISGDPEVAQRMRELLRLLRPDLEEELSLAIGDVPAHQLARVTRMTFEWGQRAGNTALRNLAEYLAHERSDLISRPEGRQLLEGTESLREDVDRLEARIALLERRAHEGPPQ
ncbi:MAG TPA: SCP2 sterol-binding domain-containing protein [Steroidobacteraceae bacterium]|nr:SCP2 sterol-binding domain-containing protein [Steroidobacteraceae bacterium]